MGYEIDTAAAPAGPKKRFRLSSFSTLSLIVSNVLVIVFAAADRIPALEVLWIYWFQSVIIGIFHFVEIGSLKAFSTDGLRKDGQPIPATRGVRNTTALFFLVHYGFFHVIYAAFLGGFSALSGRGFGGIGSKPMFYSAAIFFLRYLVDFLWSKRAAPAETPNLGRLMLVPYARIIPMHLTIILGGFLMTAGRGFSGTADIVIMVIFMLIKTVVDLITETVALGLGRKARS